MFANENSGTEGQALSASPPNTPTHRAQRLTLAKMTGQTLFEREPYLRQVVTAPESMGRDAMVTITDFFPEESATPP